MQKYLLKITAVVTAVLVLTFSTTFAAVMAPDSVGTRYETAISYLYNQGIVSGYPDGTFKPNNRINRAEFVALVVATQNIQLSPVFANCFADVKDQWFAKAVCYAKLRGWVSGYPDGFFRPEQPVNKVEAFAIVARANALVDVTSHQLAFTDVPSGAWYIPSLRASYMRGLVEETSGRFNPAAFVTRGRVSDVLYRTMNPSMDVSAQVQTPTATVQTVFSQGSGGGGGGGGSPAAPTPAPAPVQNPTPAPVPVAPAQAQPQAARQRLTAQNFTYVGAFRLPKEANGASRFGFGGGALALNPHGDSNGPKDGYNGSLYIVGHEHDQMVAEVTIPIPKKQSDQDISALSTASFLQGFSDVTGGKAPAFDAGNGYRVDGLAYLDAQGAQNSGKLYWTARTYYNVDTSDDVSHGMSETNLSQPNAQGVWRLSNYHGLTTGGYIFSVPRYFADVYLAGKRLISGLSTQQGVSGTSQGPAFFAFAPWLNYNGATPPQNNAVLSAQRLVSYPYTGQPNGAADPPSTFPDYQVPDSWDAAAWIYTPTQHAVVVTGHRAMGATYYGDARPNDCTIYKGYHGEPYEPRIAFYDPADLALSAQGQKDPATIVPYLEWNPSQYLVNTCMWMLTGAAYDENAGLFYLLQEGADIDGGEPTPLVYVFSVN